MGELEKLQTEAAKRFLQTALIVDDRASVSPQDPPPVPESVEEVAEPSGPNMGEIAGLASGESSQAPVPAGERQKLVEAQERHASEVDVKQLADRFADLVGLTCGILKPTKEEGNAEVTKRIVRAARGVDIVVVDWMLEAPGFTARKAVEQIVAGESKDRRLLAIYTTQRDLAKIVDELLEAIPDASQVVGDDLALDVGGIRIVIYHKGGPTLTKEFELYVCPEEELPERLVSVFVSQTAGLVPAVALSALAATRENTHRLLNRLHQGLDLGYLGHLVRLSNRDTGKQHLLDAISGEFRAVVEDDADTAKVATNGFKAWLTDHKDHLQVPITGLKTLGAALEDKEKKKKWQEDHGSPGSNITNLLVSEGEEADAFDSDASFAQLMAMRRPYTGQNPPLHLGTIVREREDSDHYWLCVQPVCDSVRLSPSKPTSFLMLPLDPVDPGARASFVVTLPGESDKHVFLHLWDGSSDLELMQLLPNRQKAVVFEAEEEGDAKTVTTQEGIVLIWVGQLKPAHASRVAHAYGMRLSRVGLDESEWLRNLEKNGKKSKQKSRIALVERVRP